MTKKNEIYKCEVCGNIVEVVGTGVGTLVCCAQPMALQNANTVDAAKEKHVPVVEVSGGKITIKVGEVPHPMEESHYIPWIEIIADGKVDRQYLKAGDKPEATFNIAPESWTARAYCNLHGLWSSEK